MTVLIPVDKNSFEDATLISMNEEHIWAFITLDEGKIISSYFFKNRDEITEWIDCVVVLNEREYVWPFIEEGMVVLTAPTQRNIEDIIEALLFKELYDLSV